MNPYLFWTLVLVGWMAVGWLVMLVGIYLDPNPKGMFSMGPVETVVLMALWPLVVLVGLIWGLVVLVNRSQHLANDRGYDRKQKS